MDIRDIIDAEDLCTEILTMVIGRLSENEDEIQDILDKCKTVVDVAINAVPVVNKMVDETLTESIRQYLADSQIDDGSPAYPRDEEQEQEEETVVIPIIQQTFEIENFIPICQQFAVTNKEIRDMLRSLERSFIPIQKELIENATGV